MFIKAKSRLLNIYHIVDIDTKSGEIKLSDGNSLYLRDKELLKQFLHDLDVLRLKLEERSTY